MLLNLNINKWDDFEKNNYLNQCIFEITLICNP